MTEKDDPLAVHKNIDDIDTREKRDLDGEPAFQTSPQSQESKQNIDGVYK